MSEETNDQPLINKSQHTGHINISGNEDPVVNLVNTIQGITNIDQRRTIIYNYNSQEQTVTTSTEKDIEDNLICPYQGLYHFSPEKAEYFFGRDVFVEELFQYTETRNFIPILGASGSGKSSVILAGLVPKLVKIGHWQFTHFRPGNDPFHALAQALVPLYVKNLDETDHIAQARKLAGYFQDNTVPLSDVFSTIQRNHPNNRILLIADQFEELYTLCNEEQTRRQFLDLLLTTFKSFAEQSSLSTVLVGTMRADFLGNVLSYRPLADVLQKGNIMLGPMNETELRDIIEKPAQKLGVSFESGLVERILDDVDKEPGNLPLLEFALTELWNKRKGKQLTHNAYQEIGEVSGALTGYADSQFSKLKPEEQQQVRRIFVQLVRPGAGTEDTRRVATKAELNDSNWNLVRLLADARLVVTSRTVINSDNSQQQTLIKEQETVEVVHEALIKNWGQLRQWMETDREFRTWQERLRATMSYWQEKNRDQELLLRGAALAEAEEKLQERLEELTGTAEEVFIRESIQEHNRLKQEEEDRKQREIETANKLAEAEKQARQEAEEREKQQKQANQKLRLGAISLSVLFLFASGLAGLAILLGNRARIGEENANFRAEIATLEPRFNSSLSVQMDVIELNRKLLQVNTETVDIHIQGTDLLRRVVTEPREINSLESHEYSVNSVAFSPKGDVIASASADNTVKLWNANDGRLINTLKGREYSVNSVAFSPKGDVIASASGDKTVKLWNANDGRLINTLKGHEDYVTGVAFSPKGDVIASASDDNTVKLWNANDGRLINTLKGHEYSVTGVAFSPKGDVIASASDDNTVKLWNANDGRLINTLKGHEDYVTGVAFSPKGDVIASASDDNTVKLWNANDGRLINTLKGHEYSVNSVAFSPKGDVIASASDDNTVKLWNANDGRLINTLKGHEYSVNSVAFSPKGDVIASASDDNTVKLWNANDGRLINTLKGHEYSVNSVAFSPKGDVIASASDDNTVKLWNANDGRLINTLKGHEYSVNSVAFSPKGDVIASASDDNTVKLWNANDGRLINTLKGHEYYVTGVAFSPKGDVIASASADNTVKLWNANDGRLINTLKGHENSVTGVAFSPKGDVIASASDDNTVKLWNANDGRLINTLKGHEYSVNSVAFSPKGDVIASASGDNTVKLWNANDGRLINTLKGHENSVTGVAFSPKGDVIASASYDKTVKLWNLNQEVLFKHACSSITGYLKNNPNLEEKERQVCGQVEPSATALFLQGEQLAAEGNINEAVSKFQQAAKLDSNFSLKVASASLVRMGESLAENGKIDEAILGFQKALEFDPSLKFNPKAKAAKNRFKRGQQLIEYNEFSEEAILAYNQAQELDPNLKISASDWNNLCWAGSVKKQADKVMFACNKAVELDPKNGWIRNSRGLARALTGDFKGAIEDFDVFVKLAGNAEEKKQRKAWIESLKKGKNPFTDEELEKLR